MIYDKNFPSNDMFMKDIPSIIRQKGDSLFNYIKEVEKYRNTNSFNLSTELFPDYKYLFIHSNSDIPAGLYFKAGTEWVGYSNYSFIPYGSSEDEGRRVSHGHLTYELVKSENQNIWVNCIDFKPNYFFDFFECNGTNIDLTNKGSEETDVELTVMNYTKEEGVIPFIKNDKFTSIKTNNTITINKKLTFTATFQKIERLYNNEEPIEVASKSVLLSVNDNLQNIRIGLCYDQQNRLFFYNKENVTDLRIELSTYLPYQLGLKFFNNKVKVLVNNEEHGEFELELSDKQLFFGIGNDMSYGRYSNGSFLVTEPHIYKSAISKEENYWLRNYPRTWSFYKTRSYLDLTLDEQLKLKKNINYLETIDSNFKEIKKDIEDKHEEQITTINRLYAKTITDLEENIKSKMLVINTMETTISEQSTLINALNKQIVELSKRVVNIENKLKQG